MDLGTIFAGSKLESIENVPVLVFIVLNGKFSRYLSKKLQSKTDTVGYTKFGHFLSPIF